MKKCADECAYRIQRWVSLGYGSRWRVARAASMGVYRSLAWAWQVRHCDEKEIARCAEILAERGRTEDESASRDDIRREWLRHGVAPSEYLAWRFDEKPEAERRTFYSFMDQVRFTSVMNDRKVADILVDKHKTYLKFRSHFGREVLSFDGHNADDIIASGFAQRHPVFFAKPLTGFGGRGTRRVRMTELGEGNPALAALLREIGPCVLEEPIRQHPATEAFHPASLNTVRLATLSDGRTGGDVTCWFSFFRCGRGGNAVDNTHSGGVFAQIDVATGMVCSDACDLAGEGYTRHPDSTLSFRGFTVPHWTEMTVLVKNLARELPECRYISWDLAATPDGVAVVEANTQGDLALEQAVRGMGLKEEYEGILMAQIARGQKHGTT